MRVGQEPLVTVPRMLRVRFTQLQASSAVGSSKLQALPHSTVLAGTQVSEGAAVSTTVTVWLHTLLLVQGSVACQVRVMRVGQPPLVTVPTMLRVRFTPLQPSSAV